MGDNEDMVDICLRVGGAFVPKRVSKDRQLLCWCGGWCYWRRKVPVSKLDVQEIRSAAIHGFVNGDMEVPVYFNCWYRQKGKTFNTGRRELVNSDEVRGLLETRNGEGYVEVFVTAQPNLVNIPTQSWSRHAFSSNCKSNMLLNNMCETFNAVIRPARDKPILTQMEWMRRYVMNRNNEKWEDSKKISSNLTPYVRHVMARIEFVARKCVVQPSRGQTFEVQLMDDQECVDLEKETCTCYHWELTGIPCVHAYACMMDIRGDIEAYVDPYYTMDSYRQAYEPPIQPMPGPKHWERVTMREPQPPAFKVQPGRPKSKKRKLEPGECSTATAQPQTAKRQKQCSKCAGFGHYAKTCKNTPAPATEEQRQPGRPPSNTPWMVEERKKKELRAAKKSSTQPSSSQPKAKQQSVLSSKCSSSQPATTTTQHPDKSSKCSSSQPATTTVQQPSHTGVITRAKLQTFKDVNLTQ